MSGAEDVWELSLNSVQFDWFEDVEGTYHSDEPRIHHLDDSVFDDSDVLNEYLCDHTPGYDWNSSGENQDVDGRCPCCDEWESDCICGDDDSTSSLDWERCEDKAEKIKDCSTLQNAEWEDSKPELLAMRDTYARPVLKNLGGIRRGSICVRLVNRFRVSGIGRTRCTGPQSPLERPSLRAAPFPGEVGERADLESIDRFVAFRVADNAHVLIDSAHEGEEHDVPTTLLTNPDFNPGTWFARRLLVTGNADVKKPPTSRLMGDARATRICQILNEASSYPGDNLPDFHPRRNSYRGSRNRFRAFMSGTCTTLYVVEDAMYNVRWPLTTTLLNDPRFDVYRWCCKRLMTLLRECIRWNMWEARTVLGNLFDMPGLTGTTYLQPLRGHLVQSGTRLELNVFQLNNVQIPSDKYPGLQRNAARIKDPGRKVARPIVVVVRINGHPVTALLDSGSLGSFMSTTLIDQLKFKEEIVDPPLTLQLAVQGSRSKINRQVLARFLSRRRRKRRREVIESTAQART
ncbi:hypothetical protein F5890DRAFT_1559011 [Lentinula detonsa]|uniref:Uncharacterized protein n=1 Tax=Lentinula detonsa TaxID=2804962 RepID=A0AA38PPA3_9AGAR|nr:hypothetical protein F5890DRAFT_1559011 [Lentinula detonsa]